MYLLLLKFESLQVLLTQHFYHSAIKALVIAIASFIIFKLGLRSKFLRVTTILCMVFLCVSYFGVLPFVTTIILTVASFFLGKKLLKNKDVAICLIFGFFLFLELFTLVGLVGSPRLAFSLILGLSLLIIVINLLARKKTLSLSQLVPSVHSLLNQLSLIEIVLILLALFYGSLPQSGLSWDSVYANLYNAKWYVELNSIRPIEESISSIFPQQAILYYSFFYALAGLKGLQIAYLVPLLIIFFVFKRIATQFSFSRLFEVLMQLLVFVPVVMAQASSGYYDLFIASLMILSLYILIMTGEYSNQLRYLLSLFFLSLAMGAKFFAAILAPFLVLAALINSSSFKNKQFFRSVVFTGILTLVAFGPLALWMFRTNYYTGSPIFPFFQNVFRTKELWLSENSVEQNAMTQSSISTSQWLKGGFLLYPILSYFRSEYFIEGTRGYPGIIYIVLLPFQVWLLLTIIFKLTRGRTNLVENLYLLLFTAFIGVGVIARYYRYLWPFQISLAVFTFVLIWPNIKKLKRVNLILGASLLILYPIHTVDLIESFRFVPEQPKSYRFNPDSLLNNSQDPIFKIINASEDEKPILDASQYLLPRLYLKQRSFMCNWYWIAGDRYLSEVKQLEDQETVNFIRRFSFVVTSTKKEYSNYCTNLLETQAIRQQLQEVARDTEHVVYKIKQD